MRDHIEPAANKIGIHKFDQVIAILTWKYVVDIRPAVTYYVLKQTNKQTNKKLGLKT